MRVTIKILEQQITHLHNEIHNLFIKNNELRIENDIIKQQSQGTDDLTHACANSLSAMAQAMETLRLGLKK